MRTINEIIVHCTGTPYGREYDAYSYPRDGFSKCPYHFVVHLDGSFDTPRANNEAGSHAKGHNAGSLGIAYVGGYDKNNCPADTRTSKQKETLFHLLRLLHRGYPSAVILGHRDLPGVKKDCPCFDVQEEYKDL